MCCGGEGGGFFGEFLEIGGIKLVVCRLFGDGFCCGAVYATSALRSFPHFRVVWCVEVSSLSPPLICLSFAWVGSSFLSVSSRAFLSCFERTPVR